MIKNIIYLDIDKMYSLSSQIFEGITEYILKEKEEESSQKEDQKGPIGSGKILGDILRNTERISEKKFLVDYSYNIFENKLIELNKVNIIDNNFEATREIPKNNSFIKVKSRIIFNDIRAIQNTLSNFNDLGVALTHVTSYSEIQKIEEQIEKARESLKGDREKLATLRARSKSLTDISQMAKSQGLQQDQTYLNRLSYILSYGFQDQLEIQMRDTDLVFSSNLKRNFLREEENLLIRKYSRHTEVEFTLFGIVTQSNGEKIKPTESSTHSGIKEALMGIFTLLNTMESEFSGKLSNEIIIDPIAVYTELT